MQVPGPLAAGPQARAGFLGSEFGRKGKMTEREEELTEVMGLSGKKKPGSAPVFMAVAGGQVPHLGRVFRWFWGHGRRFCAHTQLGKRCRAADRRGRARQVGWSRGGGDGGGAEGRALRGRVGPPGCFLHHRAMYKGHKLQQRESEPQG